jgi:hypothetical protein
MRGLGANKTSVNAPSNKGNAKHEDQEAEFLFAKLEHVTRIAGQTPWCLPKQGKLTAV